ncbi:transmembrane protease serine 3-like [Spea bombifrons]|uniref:transmembrane protease serine 3-like n=1 Tax=Spea bombifrons TaxID=233779 RepID=UPI002349687A|nr:transmembrane protease serine 3-like [Spea bombifrons]
MRSMHWFYALLLVCAAICIREACGACGVRKNGYFSPNQLNASLAEFPWQVSVNLGGRHICSGTIISEFWIVTAAQCVTETGGKSLLEVGLITFKVKGRLYPVKTILSNRAYSPETSENNIALLESSESIKFDDLVQPACFPVDEDLLMDQLSNCWVTSWREHDKGSFAVLEKLSAAPTEQCRFNDTENIMCAMINDMPDEADCMVKSGDSLVCQYGESKAWTLVGIASDRSSNCSKTMLFTRASYYITWLEEITEAEAKPVVPGINPEEETSRKSLLTNNTMLDPEEIPDLVIGEDKAPGTAMSA